MTGATSRRSLRWGVALALLVAMLTTPSAGRAQSTNADILQRLAGGCIAPVARSVESLALRTDMLHPFLDQAVIDTLRNGGREVYLLPTGPDSTLATKPDATLTYFVEDADVRYDRIRGGRVRRTVQLDLGYILQTSEGRVEADSSCTNAFTDEIARSDIDAVESESIPLTRGERPRHGWLRRYAEPVIVGAASAVAVYLFFNVRSDANDSP